MIESYSSKVLLPNVKKSGVDRFLSIQSHPKLLNVEIEKFKIKTPFSFSLQRNSRFYISALILSCIYYIGFLLFSLMAILALISDEDSIVTVYAVSSLIGFVLIVCSLYIMLIRENIR